MTFLFPMNPDDRDDMENRGVLWDKTEKATLASWLSFALENGSRRTDNQG
jgi:hypothetical protein